MKRASSLSLDKQFPSSFSYFVIFVHMKLGRREDDLTNLLLLCCVPSSSFLVEGVRGKKWEGITLSASLSHSVFIQMNAPRMIFLQYIIMVCVRGCFLWSFSFLSFSQNSRLVFEMSFEVKSRVRRRISPLLIFFPFFSFAWKGQIRGRR
jgi:hypothetical protein